MEDVSLPELIVLCTREAVQPTAAPARQLLFVDLVIHAALLLSKAFIDHAQTGVAFSLAPPAGARSRFSYGLPSQKNPFRKQGLRKRPRTAEDPVVVARELHEHGMSGSILGSLRRHKIRRRNVDYLVVNGERFRSNFDLAHVFHCYRDAGKKTSFSFHCYREKPERQNILFCYRQKLERKMFCYREKP